MFYLVFFCIITRLGIRGIVENILEELLVTLNMEANSNPSGANSSSSGANSRPDHLARSRFWEVRGHIGNGYIVNNNGIFVVNNPSNIISFLNILDLLNNSADNRAYAGRIYEALKFQSQFLDKSTVSYGKLDNGSKTWLDGFMQHNFPNIDPNSYWNSDAVIKKFLDFSQGRN